MVCSPSADRSSQIILSPACISNYARLLFRPSKRTIHDMTWLPPTRSYHIKTKYPHLRPTKTIPSVVPDFIVIPFIPHSPPEHSSALSRPLSDKQVRCSSVGRILLAPFHVNLQTVRLPSMCTPPHREMHRSSCLFN